MARSCAFCTHKDRQKLEESLITHTKTQAEVAGILGIDQSRVSRHMSQHVSRAVAEAISQDQELEDGLNVTRQLIEINRAAREILSEARSKGDNYMALAAIARVEKQLELQAKLLGDIATGINIQIIQSPQFVEFKALILNTLNDYPEVKALVVDRLRGMLE